MGESDEYRSTAPAYATLHDRGSTCFVGCGTESPLFHRQPHRAVEFPEGGYCPFRQVCTRPQYEGDVGLVPGKEARYVHDVVCGGNGCRALVPEADRAIAIDFIEVADNCIIHGSPDVVAGV